MLSTVINVVKRLFNIGKWFKSKGLVLASISVGMPNILNLAKAVLAKGKEEDIFLHVGFNAPEEVCIHPYMDITRQILHEGKFKRYTRIIAIANDFDIKMTSDLLTEFARNSRFMLAVYESSRAIPLNLLCVSPRHVIISLPSEPKSGKNLDAIALYIRSQTFYHYFQIVRTFLLNSSYELSGNSALTDDQVKDAIKYLASMNNAGSI